MIGKFDAFCKRIQKVIDMFDLIEKFSALSTLGVEGTDSLIKRFDQILAQVKRKPYDMLDHRKMVLRIVTFTLLKISYHEHVGV